MSFKVGDRVRLSTGVEGEVVVLNPDGGLGTIQIGGTWCSVANFKVYGITVEKVEPPLPEEFPIGAVFSVPEGFVFQRDTETDYYRIGSDALWAWSTIVERFGTDFTILEDRNKTIREVLEFMEEKRWTYQPMIIAEHFGVSLDD